MRVLRFVGFDLERSDFYMNITVEQDLDSTIYEQEFS